MVGRVPKEGERLFSPRVEAFDPTHQQLNDPVEIMGRVRAGVESLPETKALFSVSDVITDGVKSVKDEYLRLTGCWKMPVWGGPSGKSPKWVNIDAVHAEYYPEAWARCKCNAVVIRPREEPDAPHNATPTEHSDDCRRSDRLRARADLAEARVVSVMRALDLCIVGSDMVSGRLAINRSSQYNSVSSLIEAQKVDYDSAKEAAVTKRINTECYLLACGYDDEDVGKIWGVSDTTVRDRVYRLTDYTIGELRDIETAGVAP